MRRSAKGFCQGLCGGHGAAGVLLMMTEIREFPFPVLFELDPGTENILPVRQIVFDGGIAGFHPIAITDRMRTKTSTPTAGPTNPVPATPRTKPRSARGSAGPSASAA